MIWKRRGFRGGRQLARRAGYPSSRPKWISDTFQMGSLAANGLTTSTELSLVEYDDWQPTTTTIRDSVTLIRVIGRFMISPLFNAVAGQSIAHWNYILHIIDLDDTDFNVTVGSQSSILQSGRVLQIGNVGGTYITKVTTNDTMFAPALRINLSWRGRYRMNPDDTLILSIQAASDLSGSTVSTWDYTGTSRCLVRR